MTRHREVAKMLEQIVQKYSSLLLNIELHAIREAAILLDPMPYINQKREDIIRMRAMVEQLQAEKNYRESMGGKEKDD
jgi:hypothetical protein